MSGGWELFDPRDGRAIRTVRWEWHARLLTRLCRGLDYARSGDGWC